MPLTKRHSGLTLILEGLGQLYYRFGSADKKWQVAAYLEIKATQGFELHPYLGLRPIPGWKTERDGIRISHNRLGFRGRDVALEKTPGLVRVVTLGGSSTYCVKLSDDDTWPVRLEQKLGTNHQVVNLGVPGYSTAEHVVQAAFYLSELRPEVVVCYAGWNDVQNLHIRNLRADYSDYHSWRIADTLNVVIVDRPVTPFALARLFHGAWFKLTGQKGHKPVPDENAFTAAPDPRALGLYARNLRSIAALCRSQGVQLLFVPQLVNDTALTNNTSYGWVPFVRDRDLPAAIATFNQTMQTVARETGAGFAGKISPSLFAPADFLDQGHFSPPGAEKFAGLVADEVKLILVTNRAPAGAAPTQR